MGTFEFLIATWAILLTPGPTNTLLALSGAQIGFIRSLKLLPAELSGYLLAVVPLAVIGANILDAWPQMAGAIRLVAAIWVMYLAGKLWLQAGNAIEQSAVTARRVFVTTLLNPKALLFGLVLLPPGDALLFLPHLGIFVLSIVAVASLWATAGSAIVKGTVQQSARRRMWIHRCAAAWLAVLSAGLAAEDLLG
jgi:threonine/homoserine/homoserine lactone efflux protein